MEAGKYYYVVRMGIDQFSWARGDDGEAQLLVFANAHEAYENASQVEGDIHAR